MTALVALMLLTAEPSPNPEARQSRPSLFLPILLTVPAATALSCGAYLLMRATTLAFAETAWAAGAMLGGVGLLTLPIMIWNVVRTVREIEAYDAATLSPSPPTGPPLPRIPQSLLLRF